MLEFFSPRTASPPFCLLQSGRTAGLNGLILSFTRAERVAGQLLDALAVADGATIERGGVRAAAGAFLVATAAAAVAHRPLGPRRPATVDWKKKKNSRKKQGLKTSDHPDFTPQWLLLLFF